MHNTAVKGAASGRHGRGAALTTARFDMEVNAISHLTVTLMPEKTGRHVNGVLIGWGAKDIEGRKAAYAELQRPRVGRKSRITGRRCSFAMSSTAPDRAFPGALARPGTAIFRVKRICLARHISCYLSPSKTRQDESCNTRHISCYLFTSSRHWPLGADTGLSTSHLDRRSCALLHSQPTLTFATWVILMKKYVTYRRVSTAEQGKSGLGLAAQTRDIDLYLTTYSDTPYEVIGEYVDEISGMDDARPELTKAITQAKAKGAELLVAKLDRLSRRVSFIAFLMDDRKLALRVAAMPNADKFQLHIYAALAEQERDFISLRTKAALAEAKRKGIVLGGLRDKTMKRNAVVKENAQRRADNVAGLILPLRDAGRTLREIAVELDKAGVKTARGGTWQASQVKRVLARLETYA